MRKLECDAAANPDEARGHTPARFAAAVEGDVDGGSMMAGQSAALVMSAKPQLRPLPTFWPMPRCAVA